VLKSSPSSPEETGVCSRPHAAIRRCPPPPHLLRGRLGRRAVKGEARTSLETLEQVADAGARGRSRRGGRGVIDWPALVAEEKGGPQRVGIVLRSRSPISTIVPGSDLLIFVAPLVTGRCDAHTWRTACRCNDSAGAPRSLSWCGKTSEAARRGCRNLAQSCNAHRPSTRYASMAVRVPRGFSPKRALPAWDDFQKATIAGGGASWWSAAIRLRPRSPRGYVLSLPIGILVTSKSTSPFEG